jgi:hypothetical protein
MFAGYQWRHKAMTWRERQTNKGGEEALRQLPRQSRGSNDYQKKVVPAITALSLMV